MSKITRARKREIRAALYSTIASQLIEPTKFTTTQTLNEQEQEYAEAEVEAIRCELMNTAVRLSRGGQ